MFYINDRYYSGDFLQACYSQFDRLEPLEKSRGKRFILCIEDSALWLALCLYLRAKGASVFPQAPDCPEPLLRKRAEMSRSEFYVSYNADKKLIVEGLSFSSDQINCQKYQQSIEIEISDSHTAFDEDAVFVFAQAKNGGELIQLSSGSTGEPKVIARSWANVDEELESYASFFPEAKHLNPLIAAPVSHSYGLVSGFMVALKRGLEPVIVNNFHPKYILRKLREQPESILYSSPVLIGTVLMLLNKDEKLLAVMSSGTLIQKHYFESFKHKIINLYQQYGCSEVGCISLSKNTSSNGDIGHILPHHRLCSPQPSEQAQEIRISNSAVSEFSTKDLACIQPSGSLQFIGRVDDMINVSGTSVYPAEVEDAVMNMDSIADAVVFKRSDIHGLEQVCLHFVSDLEVKAEDIRSWCRDHLATCQVPLFIERVNRIERLPNGKVNRRKLGQAASAT